MNPLRSAALNFAGGMVPALAALFTVPVLVRQLGEVNYGLFALISSIVGYFAVLDVNFTAGSVKYVSQYQASGDERRLSEVVSFGALMYLGIGALGAVGLVVFAEALVSQVFNVPASVRPEAVRALHVSAAAFLVGQLQIYLQSVIQAIRRYDLSSRLEAGFGTVASLATVAAALAGWSLAAILAARLVISLINVGAQVAVIRRALPQLRLCRPGGDTGKAIASFSAYAYLSRLASLSAAHSDKLLVGAIGDMRALALYSVPFTLVTRVFGLVYRLGQVVFPFTSAHAAQGDWERVCSLYLDASRYSALLNASLFVLLAGLAPEILHYWAGDVFKGESRLVLVFAAGAILVDSLTNIPSLVNDGLGKPHITGTAAVLRALASIGAVYMALHWWGIQGAALAQLLVSGVATLGFVLVVHALSIPVPFRQVLVHAYLPSSGLVVLGVVAAVAALQRAPLPPLPALAVLAGYGLVVMVYIVTVGMVPAHRARLVKSLQALRRRRGVV